MRISPGLRIRLRSTRTPGLPSRRAALLLLAAIVAVAGVAAIPAAAAGGSGGVSVSVNVVAGAVKSVTVSPNSTIYTNCVYGSSNPMQLGFPNGACQGGSAISVQDSGTVAAVISVNGSDMIPSDNGTHWALCILNSSCSQMNPGADQYYETLSKMAGVNSGASVGPGPFLGLTNNPTCDTVLGGPMCVFSVGQTANEFLAMTGPSSSSDPSSSFSTYITWTAS